MAHKPAPWEIWYAYVRFEEDPGKGKPRPVIVIRVLPADILALKLTSAPPREREYRLRRWEEAGLHGPTTVRLGKKLKIPQTDLEHRIGAVSMEDRLMMEYLIAKYV